MRLYNKWGLLLCSPHPYLRFSYAFRPMPEGATFLFATMVLTSGYFSRFYLNHCPNLCIPNDFGKLSYAPQTKILEDRSNIRERIFDVLFKGTSAKWSTHPFEKYCEKYIPGWSIGFPKSSFGEHKLYAPQTKILENRTDIRESIFKALFKDSSPKSSAHPCEKWFENPLPSVQSDFQNLRLGLIKFENDFNKIGWNSLMWELDSYSLRGAAKLPN